MSTRMIVTDVSRMHSGACIAGYTVDLQQSIRPVLANGGGLNWRDLRVEHNSMLSPFSVIDVELDRPRPAPPHTEDCMLAEPLSIAFVGRVPSAKIPVALDRLAFESVSGAFEFLQNDRRSIQPGTGSRSLATISIQTISYLDFTISPRDQSLRFRISFRDGAGDFYNLPITDIGYRTLCYHLLVDRAQPASRIGANLRRKLSGARSTYVRIGASRPFLPSVDGDEACYLMVTGIYSDPDYRSVPWRDLFVDDVPPDCGLLPEHVVESIEKQQA